MIVHTETIYGNFFANLLGNEFTNFTRTRYFSGDSTHNPGKHTIISYTNILFKYYIWKCKLRFRIPEAENAEVYARGQIRDCYENNGLFRKCLNESRLQFRF